MPNLTVFYKSALALHERQRDTHPQIVDGRLLVDRPLLRHATGQGILPPLLELSRDGRDVGVVVVVVTAKHARHQLLSEHVGVGSRNAGLGRQHGAKVQCRDLLQSRKSSSLLRLLSLELKLLMSKDELHSRPSGLLWLRLLLLGLSDGLDLFE